MTQPLNPQSDGNQQMQIVSPDYEQFIADLLLIARIDKVDREKTAESRIKMGEIWYRWKDDPHYAKVRLTDLAPVLKRDRSYLQRCLNLFIWHRDGLIDEINKTTNDYEPKSLVEPYRTCQRYAEMRRRMKLTELSATKPIAHDTRVPFEHESEPKVPTTTYLLGGCREELPKLPDDTFDVFFSSPPYHLKRDYLVGEHEDLRARQIGLEPTLKDYIDSLVVVLREVRRVLKPSGTAWVVIDDRYSVLSARPSQPTLFTRSYVAPNVPVADRDVPAKSLMMIPERLMLALADDGWHVRMKIIWEKRGGGAPESAKDRLNHGYEIILVLTKSDAYYWNGSIGAPLIEPQSPRAYQIERDIDLSGQTARKYRDVWTFAPVSRRGTSIHPARFPEELVRRALRLACPPGGHVIDCFGGVGTTAVVAKKLGVDCTLIELSPDFMAEAENNVAAVAAPKPTLKAFECGRGSRIIHGDCLDELRKLGTASTGMILADPPYANGATELPWDQELDWQVLFEEMWRVLKIDGSIVLNCNARLLAKLLELQPTLFRTVWHWWRAKPTNAMQPRSQPKRHIEYVAVFNRVATAFVPQMTPLQRPFNKVPRPITSRFFGRELHLTEEHDDWIIQELPIDLLFPASEDGEKIKFATQKPIALGEYLIRSYCPNLNDTVLDFCTGSGSYLISAIRTGHPFIGIERDEKHFRTAWQRVAPLIQKDQSQAAD